MATRRDGGPCRSARCGSLFSCAGAGTAELGRALMEGVGRDSASTATAGGVQRILCGRHFRRTRRLATLPRPEIMRCEFEYQCLP